MYIKHNINFLIDKEKDKDDGKLRMRVKWNNSQDIVAFNVGFRVEYDKWSKETGRCKINTSHGEKKITASIINKEIQRYEDAAIFTFRSFDIAPTKDEFRTAFLINIGRKSQQEDKSKDIFRIYDLFVQDQSAIHDWTIMTLRNYAALRTRLKEYNLTSFDDFNEDGLNKLVIYFRDTCQLRNYTITKRISWIKRFLKWAQLKGYHNNEDYISYVPKLKKIEKKIIYLTWDELMFLYKYEFPANKEYLERVRDVFCFCCFTSLRYSDVANLKRSDIYDNHIEVTTVKTADSLRIELNDYSHEIIDKYNNSEFPNNLALPVISNQKMNDYLKEMGELCEINEPIRQVYYIGNKRYDEVLPKWQLLTTHAGRRTFICNALMLGISPSVIMKWTGHSDYAAMKPYIDIADKAKEDAMKLFNKK